MTTREPILQAIRQNKPQPTPLPDLKEMMSKHPNTPEPPKQSFGEWYAENRK